MVMMYVRYPLSLRNVEDLLFERGIVGPVSRDHLQRRRSLRSGFVCFHPPDIKEVGAGPLRHMQVAESSWLGAVRAPGSGRYPNQEPTFSRWSLSAEAPPASKPTPNREPPAHLRGLSLSPRTSLRETG